MGTALFVALEKTLPDVDTYIDGKMLSRLEGPIDKLAKRLKVRPLMEFFSTSADEAVGMLGEEAGMDIPPEQWFSAEEGLKTVDALLAALDASPKLSAAKDDLLGFQRVLREAQKHGVRWHLSIDF